MIPIPVPKEMVNDDAYLVVALTADPGAKVIAGQSLAELESSKSSFSIFSPADGYFLPDFAPGQMAPVGKNFGVIAEAPPPDLANAGPVAGTVEPPERDPRFSIPAWDLLTANGLSPGRFAGRDHVRRSDVEAALAEKGLAGLSAYTDGEKRKAVIMLGGGGHCRECVEIVELAGEYEIAGIVDTRARPGDTVAGYPVLGGNDVLAVIRSLGILKLVLAYGISGDHSARGRHFADLLSLGHEFPAIVHPGASVNRCATLGRGAQVMGGARVGSEAVVGDVCIVNSNCVVSHDCVLAANVHIAPGAMLGGGARIGRDAVIGMGAVVYMRVRIGEGVVVYNGTRVFADVPDGTVVKDEWHGK